MLLEFARRCTPSSRRLQILCQVPNRPNALAPGRPNSSTVPPATAKKKSARGTGWANSQLQLGGDAPPEALPLDDTLKALLGPGPAQAIWNWNQRKLAQKVTIYHFPDSPASAREYALLYAAFRNAASHPAPVRFILDVHTGLPPADDLRALLYLSGEGSYRVFLNPDARAESPTRVDAVHELACARPEIVAWPLVHVRSKPERAGEPEGETLLLGAGAGAQLLEDMERARAAQIGEVSTKRCELLLKKGLAGAQARVNELHRKEERARARKAIKAGRAAAWSSPRTHEWTPRYPTDRDR